MGMRTVVEKQANEKRTGDMSGTPDLTREPPREEPARQYYFIEKCRQYISEESDRLGHPLTAAVITFGCQMNARDSEKLSGILAQGGMS